MAPLHTHTMENCPFNGKEGGLIESDWEHFSPWPFFSRQVATRSLTAIERLVYIVCRWLTNVCVYTEVWRPNKAETDAILGWEPFLMVVDIQLKKILPNVEKVKTEEERLEPEKISIFAVEKQPDLMKLVCDNFHFT